MRPDALIHWATKDRFTLAECEELAKDLDAYNTMTFDLVGPKGRMPAKWLDAYYGLFQINGQEGCMSASQLRYASDLHCENLTWPNAQGIEARTDETPKSGSAAKPRKPDPKGCAHE